MKKHRTFHNTQERYYAELERLSPRLATAAAFANCAEVVMHASFRDRDRDAAAFDPTCAAFFRMAALVAEAVAGLPEIEGHKAAWRAKADMLERRARAELPKPRECPPKALGSRTDAK